MKHKQESLERYRKSILAATKWREEGRNWAAEQGLGIEQGMRDRKLSLERLMPLGLATIRAMARAEATQLARTQRNWPLQKCPWSSKPKQ